ncbi:Uncharacterised protein [Achromobacter spanius]|uniref:nuclear transport factor 2 family protein n=1 Tax=Achromobacter spanius TaxID=217203 RepID=UPI000C2C544B|nr:nuclear transport factor 2 family protein [Achromobacter spanius]AUA57860.1 hypothetical protein CVS48_18670 [Achromobacter spanius]CAB3626450.1 hypothetical protein LMG5911_00364 [Achromobacter spanius]SPT37241.1 Uncharacterised protein [Achromobacter denitrificans]VEE60099.1 Uncharacterised protein [Achromobacter spanius]
MEHASEAMQAIEIKAACEAVVLTFFHALDTRRHDAAAVLMAPEGVWMRQGKRLCGPQEVLAALNARAPERSTCHVITNLRLEAVEQASDPERTPARATVGYFLTAYDSVPQEQGGAPRLVSIRECRDVLVATPDGWRLADKSSRRHLPPE